MNIYFVPRSKRIFYPRCLVNAWILTLQLRPGIRHPEELSLTRRLTAAELKKNFVPTQLNQRRKLYEQSRRHHHQQQNGSSTGFNGSQSPRRTPSVPGTPQVTISYDLYVNRRYFVF